MSLEQLSYLAQMVGSVGVIVSLIFVGLQIKQNTRALERTEHNSTMEQWTVVRMAIAKHRDIAEIMTAGLNGDRVLDAADQLRLEQMLAEYCWASFHIWDRTQRGVFPKGTFEWTGGALALPTAQDRAWRRVVAQRQEHGLHSGVRRGRRRDARQQQRTHRHERGTCRRLAQSIPRTCAHNGTELPRLFEARLVALIDARRKPFRRQLARDLWALERDLRNHRSRQPACARRAAHARKRVRRARSSRSRWIRRLRARDGSRRRRDRWPGSSCAPQARWHRARLGHTPPDRRRARAESPSRD